MVETGASSADPKTGLLTSCGVTEVFHYAPLHYLFFIARSKTLSSKQALRGRGHASSHFRSTSKRADELRGFSNYVHLTLTPYPPILAAKLAAGFPHFEIRVPAGAVEKSDLHLCRYNIAKSRYIRRPPSTGPIECAANGRYHGTKQLPTAETATECRDLLRHNLGINMIEVLVRDALTLGEQTQLIFFNSNDQSLAKALLPLINVSWQLRLASERSYTPAAPYVKSVKRFLDRAVADPTWLGDGLEFDRV